MDLWQAGALMVGIDLDAAINSREREALTAIASRRGAGHWVDELIRAIRSRTLQAESLAVRNLTTRQPSEIDPRTVSIADLLEPSACYVADAALVTWCKERGAPIPARLADGIGLPKGASNYPDKLRAAIEAFEAVSCDPAATTRQSAKAALKSWLAEHRPDLSNNARDAIATVANWQPQGGAPKTPG